ncbi:MAG: hypothetical protein BHV69_09925 [Bacteroidales bacterium 52_46]|nr:MAG: hypothetical protein BHV69_09925 [Bacteroidales bacterium 52_46]
MSQSRRLRRANGMKGSTVRKALESNTPLNSLYALIPQDRRKALDRFVRCFGLNPAGLHEALDRERL